MLPRKMIETDRANSQSTTDIVNYIDLIFFFKFHFKLIHGARFSGLSFSQVNIFVKWSLFS